ncbi:MAG TPA: NUDIX hydrolase [Firmicutes bacterium]|nr:NUDIX hydrolase [Bacillota bacterium]
MSYEERTTHQERVYAGRILNLRRDQVLLPDGRPTTREVVEHPGGVSILALEEDGTVLLVRQYRYPYRQELLEIPAGKREPGEDPEACGRRELEEETGRVADQFTLLATLYPTPAYCTEVIYVYLATGLHKTRQHLDEGEFLSVVEMPLEEAVSLAVEGKLPDAKTQIALLKYDALRRRNQLPERGA